MWYYHFFNSNSKCLYMLDSRRKTSFDTFEQPLILFKENSDAFTRRVSFPLKCRKTIFWSRGLKIQNFPLGVNHGHHPDFSKLVNLGPVKSFSFVSTPAKWCCAPGKVNHCIAKWSHYKVTLLFVFNILAINAITVFFFFQSV